MGFVTLNPSYAPWRQPPVEQLLHDLLLMQRICSKTHAEIVSSQAKIISFNVLRAALLRAPAVCSKIPPSPISPALWHSEFRTMSREYGKSTANSNRNTMVLFGDAQQMREEIVKAME